MISRWILFWIRNFTGKICRENQNTCYVQLLPPPRKSCRRLRDNVENMVEPDRPQMTIWRMRVACLMTKPIDTLCNTYCFSTATVVTRTRRNTSFVCTNNAGLLFFCAKARQDGGIRESNGKWECFCILPRFIQNSIFLVTREQRPSFDVITMQVRRALVTACYQWMLPAAQNSFDVITMQVRRALVTACYQWMLPSAQKFVTPWDSFLRICDRQGGASKA